MVEHAATHPLHRLPFEWHDLPVGRLSIVGNGVVIDALPYNEEAGRYDHATLSLVEAEAFAFDIQGDVPSRVLDQLEITDFDFSVSAPGRITGTLGLLSGNHLYWTIRFKNAVCGTWISMAPLRRNSRTMADELVSQSGECGSI